MNFVYWLNGLVNVSNSFPKIHAENENECTELFQNGQNRTKSDALVIEYALLSQAHGFDS